MLAMELNYLSSCDTLQGLHLVVAMLTRMAVVKDRKCFGNRNQRQQRLAGTNHQCQGHTQGRHLYLGLNLGPVLANQVPESLNQLPASD